PVFPVTCNRQEIKCCRMISKWHYFFKLQTKRERILFHFFFGLLIFFKLKKINGSFWHHWNAFRSFAIPVMVHFFCHLLYIFNHLESFFAISWQCRLKQSRLIQFDNSPAGNFCYFQFSSTDNGTHF